MWAACRRVRPATLSAFANLGGCQIQKAMLARRNFRLQQTRTEFCVPSLQCQRQRRLEHELWVGEALAVANRRELAAGIAVTPQPGQLGAT